MRWLKNVARRLTMAELQSTPPLAGDRPPGHRTAPTKGEGYRHLPSLRAPLEAGTEDRHDVEEAGRVSNQEPWRVSTKNGLDSDAAWPTPSGRSRSPASASGSAPRSRLYRWRTAAGGEPDRERRARPVKDRARSHRRAAAAPGAPDAPIAQPPGAIVATSRARETSGPSKPLQVIQTVCISSEPGLELTHGPRIMRASTRAIHHPSLHRSG